MTEYSKYNIVYRLQKWMDSVPGQTFLNYSYSWGASIVILGTLFKLTHLPGANIMLFIGMGTEVCVFFISAFDRPFDKTAEGRDIPTHVTEEYVEGEADAAAPAPESSPQGEPVRPMRQGPSPSIVSPSGAVYPQEPRTEGYRPVASEGAPVHTATVQQAPVASPAAESVSEVGNANWTALQQSTPEMAEAQEKYVEGLKNLTDMLAKVADQSARLTRDSEEMENLNRTLTGICKIYEMQLKGASQQVGTIDQINEQSRKMAQQIEDLNKIYARMIEAMTVNARGTVPGASSVSNPER